MRPGDRLPGSRRLAREPARASQYRPCGVGRAAWPKDGSRRRRGAGRSSRAPSPSPRPAGRAPARASARTCRPACRSTLPEAPAAYRPPNLPRGTLNLSNGAPDVRLVPARSIGRAYRRALALRGADLLAYGDPEGHRSTPRRAGLDAREHEGAAGRPRRRARHARQPDGADARGPGAAPPRRRRRRRTVRLPAGVGSVPSRRSDRRPRRDRSATASTSTRSRGWRAARGFARSTSRPIISIRRR